MNHKKTLLIIILAFAVLMVGYYNLLMLIV